MLSIGYVCCLIYIFFTIAKTIKTIVVVRKIISLCVPVPFQPFSNRSHFMVWIPNFGFRSLNLRVPFFYIPRSVGSAGSSFQLLLITLPCLDLSMTGLRRGERLSEQLYEKQFLIIKCVISVRCRSLSTNGCGPLCPSSFPLFPMLPMFQCSGFATCN